MFDPQGAPWSDNPNAPKIPYNLYLEEKASFAGILISSMLYGAHFLTRLSAGTHR